MRFPSLRPALVLAFLALVIPLALAPPAMAQRDVVTSTVGGHWRIQCLVVSYWNGRAQMFGSGTIVGPRHVLTAAHVVHQFLGGKAHRVEVIPAYSDGSRPFGTFYAEKNQINVPPGYQEIGWNPQNDYVIITTTQEIGTAVGGYPNRNNFSGGEYAWSSGYPHAWENYFEENRWKETGRGWWDYRQIVSRGHARVQAFPINWALALHYPTAAGMSGAGVFNANNEIIGMCQSQGYGLRMNFMSAWIGKTVKNTPGTTAYTFTERKFVKANSHPAVFLIVGGAKLYIDTERDLYAIGGSWGQIHWMADGALDAVPTVPSDGTMVRVWDRPEVYVINYGKLWHLQSYAAVDRFGGVVHLVPRWSIDHIPYAGAFR